MIILLLALVWSPPNPETKTCASLTCRLLYHVNQLDANCVCLLFGAGQEANGGFLELFC